MMDEATFEHIPDRSRYLITLGDQTIGLSTYRDEGDRRLFLHTEVEDAYQGHGLASRLIAFALDDTREAGRRIVPLCPMVADYVGKHHGYDDIIDSTDVAPS